MKHKPSALQGKRKSANPEENLTERITFRLTPQERKTLETKAKERGLKLSLLYRLCDASQNPLPFTPDATMDP